MDGRLLIKDLASGHTARADADVVSMLDAFTEPRSPASAVARLPAYRAASVRQAIHVCRRSRLLLSEADARVQRQRLAAWKHNVASALYHAAARDIRYIQDPDERDAFVLTRLRQDGRPPTFKRYRTVRVTRLPTGHLQHGSDANALARILSARRTVRQFKPQAVPLEDVAALLHRTWGQSGWLQAGVLGRVPTRTSPSAGALHPIECYVLAWSVRGLPAGLYHYDVPAAGLRLLKPGSVRGMAMRAASGQRWVAQAAFMCVMTAVFERTLWKYELENAYRTVWYEAGHLGQTFALLATARGLGAFTTAAMQDSYIERLLGIDGVKELPVYLCGAGVPDPERQFPRWIPLDRRRRRSR